MALLSPLSPQTARIPTGTPNLNQLGLREKRWQEREAALLLNSEGRITDFNPAAAKLLGHTAGTLEGRAISAIIPGLPLCDFTPGYNLAYAAFQGGQAGGLSHTALSARGEPIPIELNLDCVRLHGIRVIALTARAA